MLKQRIITALFLIPIFLLFLFYSSPMVFAFITALVTLAAGWEWTYLMQIKLMVSRFFYLLILTFVLVNAPFFPVQHTFLMITIWWVLALFLVLIYPRGKEGWNHKFAKGMMGVLVLTPCWLGINYLRSQSDGTAALLFLFVLIWGADTVAYFTGKKWGKTKLAAKVSPGKTWEGVGGVFFFVSIYVAIIFWVLKIPVPFWIFGWLLAMVTVVFSIVGDLFESMLKRDAGLKDSGSILPGHGGLLDRIDSLTAATPVYVYGAMVIGNYLA